MLAAALSWYAGGLLVAARIRRAWIRIPLRVVLCGVPWVWLLILTALTWSAHLRAPVQGKGVVFLTSLMILFGLGCTFLPWLPLWRHWADRGNVRSMSRTITTCGLAVTCCMLHWGLLLKINSDFRAQMTESYEGYKKQWATRPVPPSSENAYADITALISLYPENDLNNRFCPYGPSSLSGYMDQIQSYHRGENPAQIQLISTEYSGTGTHICHQETLQAYLQRVQPILPAIRRIASKPKLESPQLRDPAIVWQEPLFSVSVVSAFEIFILNIINQIGRGEYDKAVVDLNLAFALNQLCSSDPAFDSNQYMVNYYVNGSLLEPLEYFLSCPKITPENLAALKIPLMRHRPGFGEMQANYFSASFCFETSNYFKDSKSSWNEYCFRFLLGPEFFLPGYLRTWGCAFRLTEIQSYCIAKNKTISQLSSEPFFQNAYDLQRNSPPVRGLRCGHGMVFSESEFHDDCINRVVYRTLADCRSTLARLGVAATWYKIDTGAYPETLEALVPKYYDTVPIDPFDGKAFRCKLLPDGMKIYSVGPNQIDDGGIRSWDSDIGDVAIYLGGAWVQEALVIRAKAQADFQNQATAAEKKAVAEATPLVVAP